MRAWRRSLAGLAAVVTAGALVAGACGGDEDGAGRGDASEQDAGSGSDAANTTTTTTASGASDEGAAGGSADSAGAVDADEIGGMSFCDGFRAALRVDSTTALAGAQQLEPPDEIAGDWQVFMEFAEASMGDEPTAGSADDIEAAGADAEEATRNVLDYVGRECGYSVDATTGEVSDGG